jgi:multiple sugar transport system permease protein
MFVPFIWTLITSFKTLADSVRFTIIPQPFTTAAWEYALNNLQPNIVRMFFNSFLIAIAVTITNVVLGSFAGYAFARLRFPGRNILFGLVIAGLLLPGAVTMIPQYLIWDFLGFNNTLVPLWAGNLFASPFYIFLLRQFYLGLPKELWDAAKVDGANPFRTWWSVAMPLTRAALIVVFVFELKAAWTDVVRPLIFLRDVGTFTLQRGLLAIINNPSIGGEKHWELLAAAGVIVTVPMIVVFFLAQRYFLEGIATTGSKG